MNVDRDIAIRASVLYVPAIVALAAGLLRKQPARQFAACLLSFLWAVPALVAVQRLNGRVGWWSHESAGPLFCGMPVELYLGWVVLWGIVPQLIFPHLRLWVVAVVMVAVDLAVMPLCAPVVQLGPHWMVGEAVAIGLVLAPALIVARWTLTDTYLPWRAALQVATSGMIFLYWVPEVVFAMRPGGRWQPLFHLPGWERQIWLQIVPICAIPGVSAVMEFVERGMGTPIPYDPPRRLVTSGVYRYCANPMQMSCAVVMLTWAAVLRNAWLLIPAAISIVYSAGLAEWDEGDDLERRFGEDWKSYRSAVRSWRVRWTPYADGPAAKLYIARTCGPCSEVRAWFEARELTGLELVDAETLAAGTIRRIRYVPAGESGEVEGVRAVGRALEHLNLGWALVGTALRLPVVWWVVQTLLDASGLGPRTLDVVPPQRERRFL